MKAIFAGTPEFARVALQALLDAGHEVPLVLTQPDRPAGRGLHLQPSPVKQCALAHGIALAQPRSLREGGKYPEDAAAARTAIEAAQAHVMVVAAYGLILPQWVLDAMSANSMSGDGPSQGAKVHQFGCLNIHASLLPRWRGAAPIQRAIEAGDTHTGVTIMQMDAGLDTGAMLLAEPVPIAANDTSASLQATLAALGARLVVQALQQASTHTQAGWAARAQPSQGVTYAHKIDKAQAQIDWQQSAAEIERKLRAFDPAPGATTGLRGELVKLWRSEIDSTLGNKHAGSGRILLVNADGITVSTGHGCLRLTQVQRAGGKRVSAAEFARSMGLRVGESFVPLR